ncbi:hypothetical protein M885DRAFT_591386 [Pelagophyceae sp. CCMP2097]|nr:hypothetical protein M885DRAFT_591386 [Pelagophyceae sp. CCMP2097]
MASLAGQALPALRRFLMQVHPDLLQQHATRRVANAKNVATLQAYLREHSYVGSAWLVFHQKPDEDPTADRRLRVVVGRGLDPCVRSMLHALGEAGNEEPETAPRPNLERAFVDLGALLSARRPSKRPDWRRLAQLGPNSFDYAAVRQERRAWLRVSFNLENLARKSGAVAIEDRCGWRAGSLRQFAAKLESALAESGARLDGFTLVLSTTEPALRVDAAQGRVFVSPSRPRLDVVEIFKSVDAKCLAQRRSAAERHAALSRRAQDALHFRVAPNGFRYVFRLEAGNTLDADDFEAYLRELVAAADADEAVKRAPEEPRPEMVSEAERLVVTVRVEDSLSADSGGGDVVVARGAPLGAVAEAVRGRLERLRGGDGDSRRSTLAAMRDVLDRLHLGRLEVVLARETLTVPAHETEALLKTPRPVPTTLADATALLRRLAAEPPTFLRGVSLAVGAAGLPPRLQPTGVLLLPADVAIDTATQAIDPNNTTT